MSFSLIVRQHLKIQQRACQFKKGIADLLYSNTAAHPRRTSDGLLGSLAFQSRRNSGAHQPLEGSVYLLPSHQI
jgi:hypothetical protein